VGATPLVVYDSNTPASGKGLAERAAVTIGTSLDVAPTAQPANEEEERKLFTSVAMSGARAVFIDNVTRPLGSGVSEAVATSSVWKDRVLGGNKMFEGPFKAVIAFTGNNVAFRARDTIRRVLYIRLESREENPETRTGFIYPDLLGTVRAYLPTFVWSALVMLRAYIEAGRPDMRLPPWGSFQQWSDIVRNCIVFCGLPDPLGARRELADVADTESVALGALLVGLEQVLADTGKTSIGMRALLEVLEADDQRPARGQGPPQYAGLRDALLALAGTKALPDGVKAGYVFRTYRRRVVGGRSLAHGPKASDATWCVNVQLP
jgi:hypothetical protein